MLSLQKSKSYPPLVILDRFSLDSAEGSGRQSLQGLSVFFVEVFLVDVVVIFYTLQPSKTTEIAHSRKSPRGFCDGDFYWCFASREDFLFWATFLCYWHSTLAFHVNEGLHHLWTLPWLLSVAYFCQAFPSLVSLILLRALRFWGGVFYPQELFTLHSFPQIRRICDSIVKKNTTSSLGGSRINFRMPQNFTKKYITVR